jgi:hypothetical protein
MGPLAVSSALPDSVLFAAQPAASCGRVCSLLRDRGVRATGEIFSALLGRRAATK